MSLIFEDSNVFSKTLFGKVFLRIHDSEKQAEHVSQPIDAAQAAVRIASGMGIDAIEMNYRDFCELVVYVLTNEDLHPDDVRLDLVRRIKESKIVEGWGSSSETNPKRLEIEGRHVF